jgi:hypothetical protein
VSRTKQRAATYCGLAVIFFLGLYVASRPEVGEFVRIAAGTPAICSLLGAFFLLLRDDIAFERNLLRDEIAYERTMLRDELAHQRRLKAKDSENTFSIGATSHMANVAFDKHVQFCEEYAAKMAEITDGMFQSGPNVQALSDASALLALRIKWAVWLTSDTEHALEPFEKAVRKVGADAYLLKEVEAFNDRPMVVKRVYSVYADLLGIEEFDGSKTGSDRTMQAVLEKLRKVLGIRELTELRSRFVERAHLSLSDDATPQTSVLPIAKRHSDAAKES